MNKLIKSYDYFVLCLVLLVISLTIPYIGSYLNQLAVSSNDGKMPVLTTKALPSYEHYFTFTNSNSVKSFWLCDIFVSGNTYFSIGDVLIDIGGYATYLFGILTLIFGIKLEKTKNESR